MPISHEQGLLFVIIENLELAIKAVEEYPEELFDLERFQDRTQCGTLYCTAGLLSTVPHFYHQGVKLVDEGEDLCGANRWRLIRKIDPATGVMNYTYLWSLFGDWAFDRLFEGRGHGIWDEHLIANLYEKHDRFVTDKELALARLQKQLGIYQSQFNPELETQP